MIIQMNGVNKTYHSRQMEFQALHDIRLEVEQGDFIAISGRSGCGKTTLLNLLGLMDHFDSGSYTLAGTDVTALNTKQAALLRNEKLGFIFQAFHLIRDYTALENVEMPLGYAGVPAKERRPRAQGLLEQVGLGDKLRSRPSQLSGGQQQRIAIARALVNAPELLLADEPTGNLDSATGEDIMTLLSALNKSGLTVIMVTHDAHVASFAHRIVYMEDGRILS